MGGELKFAERGRLVFECRVYNGGGVLKETIPVEGVIDKIWANEKKAGAILALKHKKIKEKKAEKAKEVEEERGSRQCPECGIEFIPIQMAQKSCSKECRRERKKRQMVAARKKYKEKALEK